MPGVSSVLLLGLICSLFWFEVAGSMKKDAKCEKKPDGFYADGCSNLYYGCANKVTVYLQCPSNLFFNEITQACDYKDNVPLCTSFSRNVNPGVTIKDLNSDYLCPNNENTSYSFGACRQNYLVCRNGVGTVSECASNLFYDPLTKFCTHLSSVTGCNPIPMQLEEFESSGLSSKICVGRSNEIVALTCSSKFYVCTNSGFVAMNCPDGTVYNLETNMCDHKAKVYSCNSVLHVDATPKADAAKKFVSKTPEGIISSTPKYFALHTQVPDQTNIEQHYTSPTTTTKPDIALKPDIPAASHIAGPHFCANKADGNYAVGRCETTFITCSNFITHLKKCPAELVFDGITCEYRLHVTSCRAQTAPIVEAVTSANSNTPWVAPVAVEKPLCVHGSRYAEGPCSVSYLECVEGILLRKNCQHGQVFDHTIRKCTAAGNLCSVKNLDNRIFDGLPLHCEPGEVLERGQCTNTFYECTVSRKFALVSCETDLLFDPLLKQCRPRPLILDCAEGVEPLSGIRSQTSLTSPKRIVQIGPTVNPIVSTNEFVFDGFKVPLPTANLNIFGRHEGPLSYSAAHPQYSMPFGRQQNPMIHSSSCPNGRCSGPYNHFGRAKREIDGSVADTLCVLVSEGSYGLVGCRPDYFICIKNEMKTIRCSAGLMYNSRKGICDYADKVPACVGQVVANSNASKNAMLQAISKEVQGSNGKALVISVYDCKEDGLYEIGCSSIFVVCSKNTPVPMQCSPDLFFDKEKKTCVSRDKARNCKTLPVKGAVNTDDEMIPVFDCNRAKNGIYGSKCLTSYTVCKDGRSYKSFCADSFKFDSTISRCVPQKFCGKMDALILEAEERLEANVMTICTDYSIIYPEQPPCRKDYYVCKNGKSVLLSCPSDEAFSVSQEKCVKIPSCEREGLVNIRPRLNFCFSKVDGMYRHPGNCSRVIQCYKGEGFEHISCQEGLVFDEVSGVCDYAAKYPECSSHPAPEENSRISENHCLSKGDGELVAPKDCSEDYYRCVWGKAVNLRCPDGTVYNPIWDACDYKENVKSCRSKTSS